jgi:hypothetical protein
VRTLKSVLVDAVLLFALANNGADPAASIPGLLLPHPRRGSNPRSRLQTTVPPLLARDVLASADTHHHPELEFSLEPYMHRKGRPCGSGTKRARMLQVRLFRSHQTGTFFRNSASMGLAPLPGPGYFSLNDVCRRRAASFGNMSHSF